MGSRDMDTFELVQRLSVALAIGLIIGLERGWQAREEPEGERAAGFRTHALGALLGGIWGAIAQSKGDGGAIALGVGFAAYSAAITLFRYRETGHDGTYGATTVVAAMLAFLGAFAVLGDMQVAAATGVVAAGLLALKAVLHDWVKRLTWAELRSGLVLLAMTCILLPLLPNRTIDPWAAINPFELWLMTVMIAVISFSGYVAVKTAGERMGSVILGVAGGLASSTAVTLTLSKLARGHSEERRPLLAGTVISWATMMGRVLLVVGLLNASLLAPLVLPLGLAGAALAGVGFYLLRKPETVEGLQRQIMLTNPFELGTVLKFGALLTIVTVLAKLATGHGGNAGVYALAAVSGTADVDAITLSMSRLAAGSLGADVAARAIAIVVTVNTFAKVALGWVAGGLETGRKLLAAAAVALAAGLSGYLMSGGL
jgi:uncharacterized membrane protein (DUF4010 family)